MAKIRNWAAFTFPSTLFPERVSNVLEELLDRDLSPQKLFLAHIGHTILQYTSPGLYCSSAAVWRCASQTHTRGRHSPIATPMWFVVGQLRGFYLPYSMLDVSEHEIRRARQVCQHNTAQGYSRLPEGIEHSGTCTKQAVDHKSFWAALYKMRPVTGNPACPGNIAILTTVDITLG